MGPLTHGPRTGDRAARPHRGGFSGAAALDDKGRVLGMMETRNAQLASAEGSLPPVRLIPAAAISGFLARYNIAAVTGTDDARAAVVRVICVRPK